MGTRSTTVVRMPWEQRADQFAHQHRNILAPGLVAGLVFGLGSLAHLLGGWGWVSGFLALIIVAVGVDEARKLPSVKERRICVPAWLAGGGWVAGCGFLAPWSPLMLAVFLLGLLPLWVLWAHHRRVRRGVKVGHEIAAWGDGSAVGLPGTTLHEAGGDAGEGWWRAKITSNVKGKYTLADFKGAIPKIQAKYGTRDEGLVEVTSTGTAGEGWLTVRPEARRPNKAPAEVEVTTIVGPHRVGQYEDGTPMTQAVHLTGMGAVHGATVGVTGSGKSGLVNKWAEIVVKAPDALLIITDLKPGALELRAWADACLIFTTTVAEAEVVIDGINTITEQRAQRIVGRTFEPGQEPEIVWQVDESAGLFAPELLPAGSAWRARKDAKEQAKQIAEKAERQAKVLRTYGTSLRFYTQVGDGEAFGTTALREQLMGGDVCTFRVGKPKNWQFLFPRTSEARAHTFPRSAPGTCYAEGPTIDVPAQARTDYLTDRDVARVVREWKHRQPALHPDDIAAADRATGGQWSQLMNRAYKPVPVGDQPDPEPESEKPPVESSAPRRMGSAEESREYIHQALAEFGSKGAKVAELMDATSRSKALIIARLDELERDGRVVRKGTRRIAVEGR